MDSKEVLKLWESKFLTEWNRKPNKEDLKNAPSEIREAYKVYWRSKNGTSSSKDQSKVESAQKEDDEDTKEAVKLNEKAWGPQLAKKHSPTSKCKDKECAPIASSVFDQLSTKLRTNVSSLSVGTLPRSFRMKKDMCNVKKVCDLSDQRTPSPIEELPSIRPSVKIVQSTSSLDMKNCSISFSTLRAGSNNFAKKYGNLHLREPDALSNFESEPAEPFSLEEERFKRPRLEDEYDIQPITPVPSKKVKLNDEIIHTENDCVTKVFCSDSEKQNEVEFNANLKTKEQASANNDSVPCLGSEAEPLPEDAFLDFADAVLYKKKIPAVVKVSSKEERLEKKMADGSANQNFVRINLKKKVFVRGKKTLTGSKVKRLAWKLKMKRVKCHQCSQLGHLEFECPNFGGESLLPVEMDFEEQELKNASDLEDTNEESQPLLESTKEVKRTSMKPTRKPVRKDEKDSEVVKPAKAQTVGRKKALKIASDSESEKKDEASSDEKESKPQKTSKKRVANVAKAPKSRKAGNKKKDEKEIDNQDPAESESPKKVVWSREVGPLLDWEAVKCAEDVPSDVMAGLNEFGHSSFRPGQKEAVLRILSGKSTLLVLSTGAGKSLCYQLPALLYSKKQPCLTLVVSPLVSLMEDQLVGLPKCIKAVCLHSGQSESQKKKVTELLKTGTVSVLLVSPEAIVSGSLSMLWYQIPPISFACIDEAHCVSQWSHNFRPSYLRVCKILRERMNVKTIMGLTATATKPTLESVCQHLGVPSDGVIRGPVLPNNLVLTVSRDVDKDNALITLLQGPRFEEGHSVIVYCTRQQQCESLATFLRSQLRDSKLDREAAPKNKKSRGISWSCEAYHAGLYPSRRRQIQEQFMKGKLRIVVATVAFGMGINKADIRAVIHYNMPRNPESYVQEIGRAGRDGQIANCHLFLDSKSDDLNELRRFTYTNSIDAAAVRELVRAAFPQCKCNQLLSSPVCRRHEVAVPIAELVNEMDITEETIATLLCHLAAQYPDWVSFETQGYYTCTIRCYRGASQLLELSKKNPLVGIALVWEKQKSRKTSVPLTSLSFPVVKAASSLGMPSSMAKKLLKQLEWETANGSSRRSGVIVEMSDLAFILHGRGDLSSEEKEEVLEFLINRTKNREMAELGQLSMLHKALLEASVPSFRACYETANQDKSDNLKKFLRGYFESENGPQLGESDQKTTELSTGNEDSIRRDIRNLVNMYSDATFTPRAVARIFHGIGSPRFPAEIYGRRQNRYWRLHLDVPFEVLLKLASEELRVHR